MKTSPSIVTFIKNEEGLRLTVYDDSDGNKTIGYGHKLAGSSTLTTILLGTAEELFLEDLTSVESFLTRILKPPIAQWEFDALCSFVFNVGEAQFQKSSVFTFMNRGQLINAAQVITQYCHSNKGVVLPGLFKRRLKECIIFLNIEVRYP